MPNQRRFPLPLLLLGVCLLCLVGYSLGAQNRKELEANRRELQQQIELTTKLLETNRQKKEATLDQYITLKQQIGQRRQLIATLKQEIAYTESSIDRAGEVVEALTRDVAELKAEYSKALRAAYRKKLQQSNWLFLFSSGTMNQAFRRWQYLRQYDRQRQRKARLIIETQNLLSGKLRDRELRRQEQTILLSEQETQTLQLAEELNRRNALLKSLRQKSDQLSADLQEQQGERERLSAAIENIIRGNLKTRPGVVSGSGELEELNEAAPAVSTAEESLTEKFAQQRGKLPLPVRNGVVTGYFGKQAHPTLPTLTIDNNGILLRTERGSETRVVAEGKVLSIQTILGGNYMVLVKHGGFFTVYSNLQQVYVKEGDLIPERRKLGVVATDPVTNSTELDFQLWEGKERRNPLDWLRR